MAEITKQKILDASLLLFNENGISNVRLQQIADETGISVGNLAYHFNNKEAITESLIANIITSLQELLRNYGKHPALKDIDYFFSEFYRLSNQFQFFNLDILEIKRNFPDSYDQVQPLFNKVKLQLERRLDICLQQRLLKSEINIKNVAANIWLMMFFMPVEGKANGRSNVSENQYRRRLWDYVMLYFSTKGGNEFSASIEPELVSR
jgi:AcrR family transcriptional regulator